jgi:hypothetical protein
MKIYWTSRCLHLDVDRIDMGMGTHRVRYFKEVEDEP